MNDTASDASASVSVSSASSYECEEEEAVPVALDAVIEEHIDMVFGATCYVDGCLTSRTDETTVFMRGYLAMDKDGQRVSLMTALAMCAAFSATAQRHRSNGVRKRYKYYVPFVGEVCLSAFKLAYNISNDTLTRYRAQVLNGRFQVPMHGNKGNTATKVIDEDSLVKWFSLVAKEQGELVPVRFRHQKTVSGKLTRYHTINKFTMLPAYYTWGTLLEGYLKWVEDTRVRSKMPSITSFSRILQEKCPNIKIRSPRDNVCDACVIYRNTMGPEPTVEATESITSHVVDAKAMRNKYKADCAAATPQAMVTTIDFAQNIMLPHNAQTPSMWYFLSLISVSVFGIHSFPDGKQWNLVYSERKAKKGSNEVISMLDSYARTRKIYGDTKGSNSWHVYADNCGGQVKNNFVLKFLLFLVHSEAIEKATLSFLVKGHTKNHCDRGFGNIKRHYAKRDLWILEDVERAVMESSPDNECMSLEHTDHIFRDFKPPLSALYKDSEKIQSYQIFEMTASEPGVIACKRRPNSTPMKQSLLKRGVAEVLRDEDVTAFWEEAKVLPPPPLNKEKVADIYKKVLQYVPPLLRSNPLYIVPGFEDEEEVRATKRARRKKATSRLSEPTSGH